jgi:TRAP-type C4-dicarboxylate transport system substrate-binding protein
MNAMGGNGVSMGFDQLINGLQTGVVDGAENNYPTYASGQHYRYAKYYSRTEHLMIPEILVFSKRIWEGLSQDDRDLIMSLAKEAQQRQRELWYAEEEKALADMKANGVEVIDVEDKEAFREAVQPVWEKHAADLSELIERIQAVQ